MDQHQDFIEKWTSVRKQGRQKYFWGIFRKAFIVVLFIFIYVDYPIINLPKPIGYIVLTISWYLFVSAFVSAFFASKKWDWNERKYKKFMSK